MMHVLLAVLVSVLPMNAKAVSLLDEQEEAELMQQMEDFLFADGWELILENAASDLFKKDFGDYYMLTLLQVGQPAQVTYVMK
jgi:hypothetical protein